MSGRFQHYLPTYVQAAAETTLSIGGDIVLRFSRSTANILPSVTPPDALDSGIFIVVYEIYIVGPL